MVWWQLNCNSQDGYVPFVLYENGEALFAGNWNTITDTSGTVKLNYRPVVSWIVKGGKMHIALGSAVQPKTESTAKNRITVKEMLALAESKDQQIRIWSDFISGKVLYCGTLMDCPDELKQSDECCNWYIDYSAGKTLELYL